MSDEFSNLPPLKRRCLQAAAHQATDVIPYTLYFTPDKEKDLDAYYASRGGWPAFENHTHRILRPEWIREEGKDAWDPFGCRFRLGAAMKLMDYPLKEPTLDGYEFPELLPDDLLAEARQEAEANQERFVYYQFTGCFWGRTWRLRGVENWLMDLYDHPEFAEAVLENLADALIRGIERAATLPVDSIVVGDDYTTQRGLMISPEMWGRMMRPHLKRIYDAVRKTGKILGVHCCGAVGPILEEYVDLGVEMLHPLQEEAVDIAWAKKTAGDRMSFRGGIGVQHVLVRGDPDDVRAYVRRCAEILSPGGGWLAESGKPLRPEVPVENAAAYVETLVEVCEKGTP